MNSHHYQKFKETKEVSPPSIISEHIKTYVKNDLEPSVPQTFLKFLMIHAAIGIASLWYCPQFNLTLSGKKDIYYYLHQSLGHQGCTVVCGALFLGFGALFAALLMKKDEIKIIKNSLIVAFLCLAVVSLTLFYLFGAEIYLDLTFPWLLGAVIGGAASFKVTSFAKDQLA